MTISQELRKLLQSGKAAKPHYHVSHVILFTAIEEEPGPSHVLCLSDQVEKAMDFLMKHENVEYARAIQLGRIEAEFSKR